MMIHVALMVSCDLDCSSCDCRFDSKGLVIPKVMVVIMVVIVQDGGYQVFGLLW